MTKCILAAIALVILGLAFSGQAFAQNPVKWSAPMNEYPNPWYPTAPPPSYYNPYGYYQNPYGYYGYGNRGYGGYYQQGGFSGNPYYYYYGQ
jgi:hypothetical protein